MTDFLLYVVYTLFYASWQSTYSLTIGAFVHLAKVLYTVYASQTPQKLVIAATNPSRIFLSFTTNGNCSTLALFLPPNSSYKSMSFQRLCLSEKEVKRWENRTIWKRCRVGSHSLSLFLIIAPQNTAPCCYSHHWCCAKQYSHLFQVFIELNCVSLRVCPCLCVCVYVEHFLFFYSIICWFVHFSSWTSCFYTYHFTVPTPIVWSTPFHSVTQK